MPFFGLLELFGVALVIMKLGEVGKVKNWAWTWVLLPFWGPLVLAVTIFICIGVF